MPAVTVTYTLHPDPAVTHHHHKGDVTFEKVHHCATRQEAEAFAAEMTRNTVRCTVTTVISDEPPPTDEEATRQRRLRRIEEGVS
jgi:hypothetical protein